MLVASLGAGWVVQPAFLAHIGWKVAALRAAIDAWIQAARTGPEWVLINIGVNDVTTTSQASFEADMGYVLDAIHATWPNTNVRVAKFWGRDLDAQCDTYNGYVTNVLATRGPWADVGHDERVWLKGADNGATMTYDGIHYSAAGNTEVVAQWKTVMGY